MVLNMEYRYLETVTDDVLDAIRENYTEAEIESRLNDPDAFLEELTDRLWADDSVTGNGSGSYFFSTWKAEEALAHNWELLLEAANEFGITPRISDCYQYGAEYWDVTIRCYLLAQAITDAIEILKEKKGENDNA